MSSHKIRWLGFLAAFFLFSAFSWSLKNELFNRSGLAFDRGDELENFVLVDMEGEEVDLQAYIGAHRYVWVNFWATWCSPCRQEMPLMASLYEEHSPDGFGIIAVSVSEEREVVQRYLDSNPMPFPILLDPDGSVSRDYRVQALPTSFLVDSTGKVVMTGVGFQRTWEYFIPQMLED